MKISAGGSVNIHLRGIVTCVCGTKMEIHLPADLDTPLHCNCGRVNKVCTVDGRHELHCGELPPVAEWTSSQPLRADASNGQIAERFNELYYRTGRLRFNASVALAREFAEVCVAAALKGGKA